MEDGRRKELESKLGKEERKVGDANSAWQAKGKVRMRAIRKGRKERS